MSNVVVRRCLM